MLCEVCNKRVATERHHLKCLFCGKSFEVRNYVYKQKYCSKSCLGKVNGNLHRGKKKSKNVYKKNKNYCEVYTQKGQCFLIDIEDIERVKKYIWYITNNGYIITHKERIYKEKRQKSILLHRYIMGEPEDKKIVIDHINGDKKDNRKTNLRKCAYAQNIVNSKIRKNNTSGYRGVRITESGKYLAYIKYNYKQINLGRYDYIKDAAKKYNEKAIELFGDFARLNYV